MLKRNPHGLLCQGPRVGGCREETERTSSAWKRFVAVALPARRAPLAKKAFIKKDTCIGLAEGHHFNPAAHLCTHPPPPLCVTSQNQPSSSLLFFFASPMPPPANFTLLLFFSLLLLLLFGPSFHQLALHTAIRTLCHPLAGDVGDNFGRLPTRQAAPPFRITRPPPAPKAYCHHTQCIAHCTTRDQCQWRREYTQTCNGFFYSFSFYYYVVVAGCAINGRM